MNRPGASLIVCLVSSVAGWMFAMPAAARELTIGQRVAAEERIQRVYYAHQIGATPSFEQAVPREVLERRVRSYLKLSLALERFWKGPVTAQELSRELDRIAASTRMPERLKEIYDALDDDAFMVQECVARPALVQRWVRTYFTSAPRMGRSAQGEVAPTDGSDDRFDRWWASVADSLDETSVRAVSSPSGELPQPSLVPLSRMSPSAAAFGATDAAPGSCIPDNIWENGALSDRPIARSGHSAVWTGSVLIVWGGLNGNFFNTGGRYDPILDTWTPTSTLLAPTARSDHSAVWTGSKMIVWGGQGNLRLFGSGGIYDPVADSWTATNPAGAPTKRLYHTAVWTGSTMVVWGGRDQINALNTGARYNPATDTWLPVTLAGAPSAREFHTSVWDGARMLVFGGDPFGGPPLGDGGIYDPAGDAWSAMPLSGAPSPRFSHSAVWDGREMIVFGGATNPGYLATGGRFNRATGWSPMSTAQAPSPREKHTAVWTGFRMIVWGGDDGPRLGDGGSYDPRADVWGPISSVGSPTPRIGHVAAWTGEVMLVWGGEDSEDVTNTGGRYDPHVDGWRPMGSNLPTGRFYHTAVWTGNQMILWGGLHGGITFGTGGRYDPVLDTWSPTTMVGAPAARAEHTAVWSGQTMVVWGGAGMGGILGDGGRYDPIADTWLPVSTSGAPGARNFHAAVWTGSRMIVWGGQNGPDRPLDGGRYDPVTDTWLGVSSVGVPSGRADLTAVWTGSRMIVWGGRGGSDGITPTNTGGLYDPVADAWQPTSTVGAPIARWQQSAVWTGSRMVIWGGETPTSTNTGGLYDPGANTWVAMSTTGAPAARTDHTAVWTGSVMIVWGGRVGPGTVLMNFNDGGKYDPASNTWSPTSTTNAPAGRYTHTALWFGGAMGIWGGYDDVFYHNDGGRYGVGHPDTDGDGVADLCDCAPSDPTVFAIPAEARELRIGTDKKTLSWISAAPGAGSSTLHDVLRGSPTDPVGTGSSEICLISGLAGSSTTDDAVPLTGTGFRYLVRGRNSCGRGTYGHASSGAEEISGTCP